jgi:hypothetical protein
MESKSRLFLTAAMAALVLNIAIAAAAALTTLSRIHKEESALRASAVTNSRRLERVRAAIYLSASEPRSPSALDSLRDDTLRQLTRPDTASLRGEVVAWFRLLELMNEMAERPQSPGVDAWFRKQIAQRRSTMLELSNAIAAALDREWQSNQQQLDSLYSSFRAGLALGSGSGVRARCCRLHRDGSSHGQARSGGPIPFRAAPAGAGGRAPLHRA